MYVSVFKRKKGTYMAKKIITNIYEQELKSVIERVRKLDGAPLEKLYADVCSTAKRLKIKNGAELMRRQIYYQLQVKKYGDLGRKYKNQLLQYMNGASKDYKVKDKVIPANGTVLRRTWKGQQYVVENKDGVYYYEGQAFTSLSAVAKHITGHERSGPAFFGLAKKD
jgi:hypothetical protein